MARPPRAAETLQQVLDAAIADLSEHGFDSAERLAYWQLRLAEAAERSARSLHQAENELRRSLGAIYDRLVDKGAVLQRHRGITRTTLQQVQPQLRAELQRRILASADLIRLNRQEALDKVQRRFAGWASSIPAGGSDNVERREEKARIRAAVAGLAFEERRVIIDQGHKLVASINQVVAEGGGAVACIWHSHVHQRGYNFRPEHAERDELVYLLRDSWAREAGLVKPGEAGFYDQVTAVGQEVFCRCYLTYIYNLRDLPPEMLTKKGLAKLEEARASIARMRAQ